jgi:hypothetical protein
MTSKDMFKSSLIRKKQNSIKQQKLMLDPNILLTNICNQRCPYCFAQEGMMKAKAKYMSLEDFKKLASFLQKQGVTNIRLMGGEPTIHPEFGKILEIAFRHIPKATIFTNGLVPSKSMKIIEKNLDKLTFVINIGTVAFKTSPATRKEIVSFCNKTYEKTEIIIGFTLFKLDENYACIFDYFRKAALAGMGVRFGVAKNMIENKQYFRKNDRKLGKRIVELVELLRKRKVKSITLDCGLTKDMFSQEEIEYLSNNVKIKGWGCNGKWGGLDIDTDLSAFTCFPYSNKKRITWEELQKKGLGIKNNFFNNEEGCLK